VSGGGAADDGTFPGADGLAGVAASHHDATLNNGATPYTTSVDSTKVVKMSNLTTRNRRPWLVAAAVLAALLVIALVVLYGGRVGGGGGGGGGY